MKLQPELFNDHPANADASAQTTRPTGTALRLGEPGAAGAKLSPAQKRFNSLLARIDKLKVQLADIQIMTDAHRSVYQAIHTGEGWLFLAVVIDLFSRQVVGWSLREDMTRDIEIGRASCRERV